MDKGERCENRGIYLEPVRLSILKRCGNMEKMSEGVHKTPVDGPIGNGRPKWRRNEVKELEEWRGLSF